MTENRITAGEAIDAMLQPIPDAHRETFSRCLHTIAAGDPSSGPFQLLLLLSAYYSSVNARTVYSTNGSQPPGTLPMLKSSQLDALAAAIKSLPRREDIEKMLKEQGGGENRELTAFLDEWRVNKAIALSKKEKIKAWVTQISAYGAAALFLVGAGYGLCWVSLHQSVDEKVDRLIGAMPFNTQAQAYLASHRGSVFVGPLQRTQDHPETDGIVINPGNLHLSQSWVSSGGYTVVPIR